MLLLCVLGKFGNFHNINKVYLIYQLDNWKVVTLLSSASSEKFNKWMKGTFIFCFEPIHSLNIGGYFERGISLVYKNRKHKKAHQGNVEMMALSSNAYEELS